MSYKSLRDYCMRADLVDSGWVIAELDRLKEKNAELKEALKLASSFIPKGPVPEGPKGNPMFYFTGTYEGDVELQKQIDAVRNLIK